MRYAHFAEICEKCGKMQNMRKSDIRVKLTSLNSKDTTPSEDNDLFITHGTGPSTIYWYH